MEPGSGRSRTWTWLGGALAVLFLASGFAYIDLPTWRHLVSGSGAEERSVSPPLPESLDDEDVWRLMRHGRADLVRRAIEAKRIPAHLADDEGRTLAMLAALNGDARLLEVLIERDVSLAHRDRRGFSPLSYALAGGHGGIAERLLEAGASPETMAWPGESALTLCARTGRTELVARLLSMGVSALAHPEAVRHAREGGRGAIVELLMTHGASPLALAGGPDPLGTAVRAGDAGAVAALLAAHGPDLIATAEPGLVASAVAVGDHEILDLLLEAGADPDDPSNDERTPLEIAVALGDHRAVRAVLDRCGGPPPGVDLVARALQLEDVELAWLLLENGVPPDAGSEEPAVGDPRTEAPEPALFAAYRLEAHDLLRELVLRGADTLRPGPDGQPLLAAAVVDGRHDTIRLLLESGTPPDCQLASPATEAFLGRIGNPRLRFYVERDSGFTPLMIAAGLADVESIRLLLAHGAETGRHTASWKRYPISLAAENGDITAQQLILGRDPRNEDPADAQRVVISLSRQEAVLYRGDTVVLTSPVSTGRKSDPTPTGEFVISNKHRNWTSTIYEVPMPYFMRFSCAAFGMHVGHLPGYPASHGCIRMPRAKAIAFFKATRLGDPVTIVP